MNRLISLILSLLLCSTAIAQRAVIVELPDGRLLGVAYTPSGSIVLTDVTIVRVPKPEPPQPPAPVTTGPVWLTTIVDGRRVSPDQSSEIIELRDWIDAQDAAKVRRSEFSPAALDEFNQPDKRVAAWVALIPEAERDKPYAFLTQARTTDGKHVVLWKGPLTKAATLIDETKRRAGL